MRETFSDEVHMHRRRRTPVQTLSPCWTISIGITAVVGIILLWNTHDATVSSTGVHEGVSATSVPARNTAFPAKLSHASALKAIPLEPRSSIAIKSDKTTPITIEPTKIANDVAHLLGVTPELDIRHLSTMIDIARDHGLPLTKRVSAIRWLARLGDDKAVDFLERLLLDDASTTIRTAVATALGECPNPDATRLLIAHLEDQDLDIVLGVIHGLEKQHDPQAIATLRALFTDAHQRAEVRSAAAEAMGHQYGTVNDLRLALGSADEELVSGALMGLGQQPFTETEPIFRELFADPNTPIDMKLEAVDALGEGTPQAADYLLELASSADDPTLRGAAIDALSLFDEPGTTLNALGGLILGEPSADVRADLYNALSLHAELANAEPDAWKLVQNTLSETTPRAQLEGYRMVASMLHDQYQPRIAATFDTRMVTWLRDVAEHSGERYIRSLSVDALRLANTPASQQALIDLSYSADPALAQSAQKALQLAAKTEVPSVP
jgi:HEAT repeat protein